MLFTMNVIYLCLKLEQYSEYMIGTMDTDNLVL